MNHPFRCIVILTFICSYTEEASANAFDLFGTGGRATAMGNALTAAAADYSAAYYNPANLTYLSEPSFAVGATVNVPQLNIQRANANGAYTSEIPKSTGGITLGLALPLPGKLGERLHTGAVIYVPVGAFVRVTMIDAAVPSYYLYDHNGAGFVICAGLGLRITDWLSLGVGFHTLASIAGPVTIQLDIANQSLPLRTLSSELRLNLAPIAGISISPPPGLSLGFSYRGQLDLKVNFPATVSLVGLDVALELAISGTTQWSPHTFNFGIAYMLPIPLMLMLDASYALWSLAPDPSFQFGLDLKGGDIDRLGLSSAFDAPKKGADRKFPARYFSNTLGARAGLEVTPID